MLAKRILAGIFAVTILLKLIIGIINPHLWSGAVAALLGHEGPLTVIYLLLIVITGYYVFSTLDVINLALAMLFTSLLIAMSIIPYAAPMMHLQEEIIRLGVGKAWLAALIWGALALVVLYQVFSPGRAQFPKE